MIFVTKPFLPPKDDYKKLVDDIWERNWLTNNGPILNDLELKLKEYLGLDHLLFLTNGTIAIQIAIKALELKGEVITTPFSYIATTSSIIWEGLKPVFVDIDEMDFNINPDLIESAINKKTTAILATHVFGNPCKIEMIENIAKKHKLKVIYDAAHCFGTKYMNKSVLEYGDISTTSFHATKLYNTVEGGAVITKSSDLLRKMALLRNFGHTGPTEFDGVGINAKNSEFHAAMGLLNLKYADAILEKRKEQWLQYKDFLSRTNLKFIKINQDADFNYSYFPVVFETEEMLLKVTKALNGQYVYPRRYFYPSLNTVEYAKGKSCPISEDISSKVLVLPLYHELKPSSIDMICRIIIRTIRS